MRATKRTCWAMALLVSASLPARAQLQDSVSRVGAVLAHLQPKTPIRVRTPVRGWVEGHVESSSDSLVIMRTATTLTTFRGAEIDSIFVRHSHARKGFLIGAASLGIPMATLGAALANACVSGNCYPPPHQSPVGTAVKAGLLGVLLGGAVGGAIGSASHQWSLAPLSPAQRVGLALTLVGTGERVRIDAGGIGRVEGDFVSRSANVVTLSRGDQRFTEVPASSMDSLWVKGNHAGIGALVGFAVGGLGLLAGYAASNPSAGPSGLLVGLAGGGAGAVLGTLIGAAFPKWRLQVP